MVQVKGSGQNLTQEVSADTKLTEFLNLSPFTDYMFQIHAITKAGSGPVVSISSKTPEGGEI